MTKEMNLIFNLQLFTDPPTAVSLPGTSASDEISIQTLSGGTDTINATVKGGSTISGGDQTVTMLNAGAGNDTITVGAHVAGVNIIGGAGNDKITILSSAGGNIYSFNKLSSGQTSADTIYGWKADDTLRVFTSVTDTKFYMSKDGKDLFASIKGGGTVKLVGFSPTDGTSAKTIKVQYKNSTVTSAETVPYAMHGTDKADDLENIQVITTTPAATVAPHNGGAYAAFSISGGAGNDNIINEGDKVYIDGGAGNDKITVRSLGNADKATVEADVTSNVTIKGGVGSDSIDISKDIYTVTAGTSNSLINTISHAGHVFEYNQGMDGLDYITGFSAADTLVLTGDKKYADTTAVNNLFSVDDNGNLVMSFTSKHKITFQNAVEEMNGKSFKIVYKDSNGDSANYNYTVPKEWYGTKHADTLNMTAGTVQGGYEGFKVSLGSGNDTVTVKAASAYIDGGANADYFTLHGGTNITVGASGGATTAVVGRAVTIYGGAGNDIIDATNDKVGDTLATHVYSFKSGEGKDSIFGYNENDTIHIEESNVTLSGAFSDETGNYILTIKGTKSGTVELQGLKGNDKLNIMLKDAEGNYFVPQATVWSDGATAYDGPDDTVITSDTVTPDYYRIAKQAAGTSTSNEITVSADDNDFVIDAGKGNDTITIEGADNVYVNAGDGDDIVTITSGIPAGGSAKYSKGLTINGGLGNDTVYSETIGGSKNPTGANYAASPKVYEFSKDDGNDVIYGFNEYDTVHIANGSKLISVTTDGNDAILQVGASGKTKVTSTIRLVNYAAKLGTFASYVNVAQQQANGSYSTVTAYAVPKILKGDDTANNIIDGSTNNTNITGDGFLVQALGGNDTITTSKNALTIDGGAGNDKITVNGNYVSINGGEGADYITLGASAAGVTVAGGTGKSYSDTIFGSYEGNEGNVYQFKKDQGTNYIVNFRPGVDRLVADGAAITSYTVTDKGLKVNIGSTVVYLRGTLKTGGNITNIEDYKLFDGDSEILVTDSSGSRALTVVKQIVGTTGNDVLANTVNADHVDADGYLIKANAGNDLIYGAGENVTIQAGDGNDTILLTDPNDSTHPTRNSVIELGIGNDVVVANGEGNYFKYSGGNDTIYGFSENDTLEIVGASKVTPSVTANGLLFLYNGKTTSTLLIKGQRTGSSANSLALNDYARLDAGTTFQLKVGSKDMKEYTVPLELKGTVGNDPAASLTNSISGTEDGLFKINALAGDDGIVNSGSYVSISGGAGADNITLKGGATGVIVNAGQGNDKIYIQDTVKVGHVFEIKAGDGVDTIYGLSDKDTIHILGKATTADEAIADASFKWENAATTLSANNNAYTITLAADPSTKIVLLGDTVAGGYKSIYNNKKFYIQYGNAEAVEYVIPSVVRVEDATVHTFTNNENEFRIAGDEKANKVVSNGTSGNEATDVYISLGAGDDKITVGAYAENNTINPGTGNDYVTLGSSGHIYEYKMNDGDDTIDGWTSNDTLVVYGATSISTLMSSVSSGNGVGKDFQLKVGTGKITFQNTDESTVLYIYNASDKDLKIGKDITIAKNTTVSIEIPKVIIGTSGGETIDNNRSGYTISAGAGNDTITNSAAEVSINAGAGNDTIVNTTGGDDVSILAGDGDDTVSIAAGKRLWIDGGKSADVITLSSTAQDVTISGGEGNDKIYGNTLQSTFVYGKSDGNDSIFGYNGNDIISLGSGVNVSIVGTGEDTTAAASMTADGFVVYLTNKSKLTFKGAKDGSSYADLTGGTQFNFKYTTADAYGNSEYSFAIPYQKFIDSDHTINANKNGYHIIGTAVAETITVQANSVVVEANAGDDQITVKSGANASLNAGAGNDTVFIKEANISEATVDAGLGNDIVVSNNQGGHVYRYTGGKDSIYGFNEDDTIQLVKGSTYQASVTGNGILLTIDKNTSNTILLKGAYKSGTNTNGDSYEFLKGGTTIHIVDKNGNVLEDGNYEVEDKYVGTTGNDAYNVSIEGYVASALQGNDTITVSANDVSLNAGDGDDKVIISSGENVTVYGSTGDDLITVTDTSGKGHVFEFKSGDGTNTIKGFGANDSIRLTNLSSIKSAEFTVDGAGKEYFLLTLDKNTKVYLQGADVTATVGTSSLRKSYFNILYKGDTVSSQYYIPNSYVLKDHTINAHGIGYNQALIIEDESNKGIDNVTVNSAEEFTVKTGSGNDLISIESSAKNGVINPGKGSDIVTLKSGDHIYEFDATADGKDIVYGWQATDLLKISGATSISTVAGNGDFIVKSGKGQITFKEIAANTNIKIQYINSKGEVSGEENDLFVPKIQLGTKNSETLNNTIEGFLIQALGGDDTITNGTAGEGANDVTIDAGEGNDTIDTYGDRVSISGGAGKDIINVIKGSNVSINAGDHDDFITLGADVADALINGGKANDVIYLNDNVHTIEYTKLGGSDSIFGYISSDAIKLGEGINISVKGTTDEGEPVYATELTYDGFIIHLDNGQKLTLRGKQINAGGDEAADFDNLDGGVAVDVYQNGSTVVTNLFVPYERHISTKQADTHVLENQQPAFTEINNYALIGTTYADTIINDGENVSIKAGNEADMILNTADNVYIEAGNGDDTIYLNKVDENGNDLAAITIGSGANTVTVAAPNATAGNNTIYGGAGDDLIYGNANGNIYQFFAKTDGNDTIIGFSDRDTIYLGSAKDYYNKDNATDFTGNETNLVTVEYKNIYSNRANFTGLDDTKKDVILNIGSGSIYLKDLDVGSNIKYVFDTADGQKAIDLTVKQQHIMEQNETVLSNAIAENYIISKLDQAETINNSGVDVSIIAGDGKDTITNTGDSAYINAGSGADTITNNADFVSIEAGDGKDTIVHSGSDAYIDAGIDDDFIKINSGYSAVVNAGDGDDFITVGSGVGEAYIKLGAGADTITLGSADDISVEGGEGDDLIRTNVSSNNANIYIYNTGDCNDIIEYKSGDELYLALDENSTFTTKPSENGYVVTIYTPNTKGTVTLEGSSLKYDTNTVVLTTFTADKQGILEGGTEINIKVSIGGAEVEGVAENAPYKVFVTDNAPATLENGHPNYEIVNEGDEAKLIVNASTGTNVTIGGSKSGDTIYNGANNVIINSGAGNDIIYMATVDSSGTPWTVGTVDVSGVTINAGAGDDVISVHSAHANSIRYEYDNSSLVATGNDTIYGFDATNDVIHIAKMSKDDYKYTVDSANSGLLIQLDNGSIKLNGIAGNGSTKVKLIDDEDVTTEIVVPTYVTVGSSKVVDTVASFAIGDGEANNITVSSSNVYVNAGAGNDAIKVANVEDVSIVAGAGTDTITATSGHSKGVVYIFGNSDGENLIQNASQKDSIKFTDAVLSDDSYYTVKRNSSNKEVLILSAGSTKVSMEGYSGGDKLTVIDKNNDSQVISVPRLIVLDDNVHTLNSAEDNYKIQATDSGDTITNSGDSVYIEARKGNDSIKNSGVYASIDAGAGNDTIINEGGDNTSIFGGEGADVISIKSGAIGLKVYGGKGNDSIYSANTSGVVYQISGADAVKDVINGFTSKDTIQIMDNSTYTPLSINSKSNGYLTLTIGKSTLSIKGSASDNGIEDGKTINIIDKNGNYLSSQGGATVLKILNITEPNQTTEVPGDSFYVAGTASVDNINNKHANVSIVAGGGADVIDNNGANASISAGAAADKITNSGDGVTIWGGAGNDLITNTNTGSKGVVYQFGASEGTDSIIGYDLANDKIWISGATAASMLPSEIVVNGSDKTKFSFTAASTKVYGTATADITTSGKNTMKVLWGTNKTEKEIQFVQEYNGTTVLDNSSNIALKLTGTTGQTVTNTAAGVSIVASANDNDITNTAENINSETIITRITTGGGKDTITNGASGSTDKGNYAVISSGAGNDVITNYAANVSITSGAGNDNITSSGNGGYINVGAGNDVIDLSGASGEYTIVLGAGNDTVTAKSTRSESDKNVYRFTGGTTTEGTNVIENFVAENDRIYIAYQNASLVSGSSSGNDLTVKVDTYGYYTNIVLKDYYVTNGTGASTITFENLSGTKTLKIKAISGRVAEEPVAALDDLFADDNYITNDAQISDITALTQDNYSAGDIETFDLENIAKSGYTPTATYGEDKDKK